MNIVGKALDELYKAFDIFNEDKFDGILEQPVITIQKGKGLVLGHFTLDKVWCDKTAENSEEEAGKNENENKSAKYEINIDPRYFRDRDAVAILGTLLHEMVHYYNKVSGVKDCSGNIHNKKFKRAAESVGLVVTNGKSVGWGYTSVSDELREYIQKTINPDESVFDYFRMSAILIPTTPKKRKKTMFKFTCPICGMEAKARKGCSIVCGECNETMEMEDDDEEDDDSSDS